MAPPLGEMPPLPTVPPVAPGLPPDAVLVPPVACPPVPATGPASFEEHAIGIQQIAAMGRIERKERPADLIRRMVNPSRLVTA
jgi:hypothetical protein